MYVYLMKTNPSVEDGSLAASLYVFLQRLFQEAYRKLKRNVITYYLHKIISMSKNSYMIRLDFTLRYASIDEY